jgi:hemoglobin
MSSPPPTLYVWAGGETAFRALFTRFYERVADDALLAPVFAHMDPAHAEHVAAFVGEVFGGPKLYSEQHGGHPAMIRKHLDRALDNDKRKRWVALLLDCADEVGMPDDPEFRSAFVAYLEWGSRLAVINSAPDADATIEAPMPEWGWGEAKGPYIPEA